MNDYKRGPYKLVLTDADGVVLDQWTITEPVYIPGGSEIEDEIITHESR